MLAVTATIFSVYTYVNMKVQTNHLMESVLLSANRVSDVIKRSTRYSMLLNRREDIYRIIKTIADEPGIQGIRIYNKKGAIIYCFPDGGERFVELADAASLKRYFEFITQFFL